MEYSIGIDIGTTTVKCILFGEGVQVVAEAGREYKTLLPKASWAQQNPEDWWKGVAESIRSILTESRVAPEDIKVISVSSQAPAVLPMTKEGEPLHDALIWMDRRSTKELEILEEKIGTKKVYGYINYKLTEVFSIDATHASLTQLYDVHNNCWSEELFEAIGGDTKIMPDIYDCMDVIGHVSKKAAEETGLSMKTVVLGGAVDASAAALEVGVYGDGSIAEMTGTSSVVMFGFDGLVTCNELSYLRGVKENTTILFGAMNTAGGSLKWFRDALYGGETPQNDAYPRINKEIEAGAKNPTGLIFLPYMAGERAPIWDPNARGTFMGLNMNTTRAEMLRAVMEGTSFALQDNLDQAIKTGIPIRDFICCGGCSKSDIWLKIKASVIGQEIKIPSVNLGAPGGLGYMNAAFMGEYKTPEDASRAALQIKKIVEPVEEWIPIYKELYQIYLDSYQSLKSQFAALAQIK